MVVYGAERVFSNEVDDAGDAPEEAFCYEEVVSVKLLKRLNAFSRKGFTVVVEKMDDAMVRIADSDEEDFCAVIAPEDNFST